jgi:hypothetical protein
LPRCGEPVLHARAALVRCFAPCILRFCSHNVMSGFADFARALL